MKLDRLKITAIILIIISFVVFSLFYFTLTDTYALRDGEYIKSLTSPHVYYISDIAHDISTNVNSEIIQTEIVNQSINVLYFNQELNCLKIAKSNSLKPKSIRDWQTYTVANNVLKEKLKVEKSSYSNRILRYDDRISINNAFLKFYNNKLCVSYVKTDSEEDYTNFTIYLLIAKTENPRSPLDWDKSQIEIKNYPEYTRFSLGYFKGQYLVLVNKVDRENVEKKASNTIELFAYKSKDNIWLNTLIASNKENEKRMFDSSFIEDPNQLLIISHVKTMNANLSRKARFQLLSITDSNLNTRTNWVESEIPNDFYSLFQGSLPSQVVQDISCQKVYLVTRLKDRSTRLITFKIVNRKISNLKEINIPAIHRPVNNYKAPKLSNYMNYYKMNLLNHNPKLINITLGIMDRYDIDFSKNPPSYKHSNIDFFTKLNSEPASIMPISFDNGISFAMNQAKVGKLRFAREIDPSEVPKRKSWFNIGKLN